MKPDIYFLEEIQRESGEQHQLNMIDLASVRVVHGPVMNRMTKNEILPQVEFISFCPYSSNLFCVTGSALFKIYEIENQNVNQQTIHFRPEFYQFTCHCWLSINSILVRRFTFNDLKSLFCVLLRQLLNMDIYFGFKMVRFARILTFKIRLRLI